MRKYVLLAVILSICIFAHAQKRTFLRFYNGTGHRFQKGFFAGTSDSSIFIYHDSGKREILVSAIDRIKMRRSIGHSIAVGTAAGAAAIGLIGVATSEEKQNDGTFGGTLHDAFTYNAAEGLVSGLLVGGVGGAATGALVGAFRKRIVFNLHGSLENWRRQKMQLEQFSSGR